MNPIHLPGDVSRRRPPWLASALWVPNLWLGGNPNAPTFLPTFYHHDGLVQNADGLVFFTDKNNFFLGCRARHGRNAPGSSRPRRAPGTSEVGTGF